MFKKVIMSKVRQSYAMINTRAEQDPAFRQRVLQNPREAVRDASGFNIPPDWDITIIEVDGRLRIQIKDDRWLRRFGLTKDDAKKSLGDIIV